ncbi:ADP-ribosylglycohydrolase family protein [Flammeovirga sp. SJP92]|uniref:ADP-ribosylglycohydrolase family protein n=1 Tax=Flammeovirga sp. SJP92 TaxID=1775430 RepID=UPI000787A64E|nr:ADP-ribosylglycohydrolase family protein [Flammeovirga sp. SJP92]KXX69785.1 hypothetical protein AVL50_12915 [Flammeovirga sp. SJP92]
MLFSRRTSNKIKERLLGCLIGGAIGDSIGGYFEGNYSNQYHEGFRWTLSDDTQLTLATCEAIYNTKKVSAEQVAKSFLKWFNERRLTGLGSSTLKALRELQVGGHWALVGRSGEYGAGNGAAMRIAPLAFKSSVSRLDVQDISIITHKNDEAYIGALCIYKSLVRCLNDEFITSQSLIKPLIEELPDTRIRDRLIELEKRNDLDIEECGKLFPPSGYVVDSVPFSIFCAEKIVTRSFRDIIISQIKVGGDTDTVCSMTGQIIGTAFGVEKFDEEWVDKAKNLNLYPTMENLVSKWKY